ncbi:unnamed protein product [Blepharisma stoltei]|uniref:Phosphodiesterase n=1 Tax=Blepharisma stoltei TaxID=1481888 RepID=A0AAU9KEM6_9CILI|nr:unnamed protein product [Blepharisma stoltei]
MATNEIRPKSLQVPENSGTKPAFNPQCAGDIVFSATKNLAQLFKSEKIDQKDLESDIVTQCKLLTSSSWVEILLKEEDKLKVLGRKQTRQYLDISTNSLPGFVATKNVYQIINNPRNSGFYQSFQEKLLPYSKATNSMEEPFSVCAIPIYGADCLNLQGVIILYNKLDQKRAQAFFTVNDVLMVQSAGLLFIEILNYRKKLGELKGINHAILKNEEEGAFIQKISNQMIKREKILKICKKIVKTEQTLTPDYLALMCECLDAQAGVFYINVDRKLNPFYSFGINSESDSKVMINTQTSNYSAFTSQGILNIKDLRSEPLWRIDIAYRGILSCPIFDREKVLLGVVEFFKQESSFKDIDEKFAKSLIKILGEIPYEKWQEISQIGISHEVASKVSIIADTLKCFTLNTERLYGYSLLFDHIKQSMKHLICFDSSAVYIVDHKKMSIWTTLDKKQDTISYPLNENSLLGLTFFSEKTVIFPSNAAMNISDIDIYRESCILSIPIFGNLTEKRVIGIIVVRRTPSEFKHEEINLLVNFSNKLSTILDNLFASGLIIDTNPFQPQERSVSPKSGFRRLNSKSVNQLPVSHRRQASKNKLIDSVEIKNIITKNSAIEALFHINLVPWEKLQRLSQYQELIENSGNSLKSFAKNLQSAIPCQAACMLLKYSTDGTLYDILNENLLKNSGLVKQSIVDNEIVLLKEKAYSHRKFDVHIDSLGVQDQINSFLCIPISSLSSGVDGVICFVNSPENFPSDDVIFAQYLSVISREILQMKVTTENNWQTILKEGRKHKMLLRSFKQITETTNYAQFSQVLSVDLLRRLANDNDTDSLISIALEVIKALSGSEGASCIWISELNYTMYQIRENKLSMIFNKKQEDFFSSLVESERPALFNHIEGKENILYIPIRKDGNSLIIKAWNKKDETYSLYVSYTREDEIKIKELGKYIFSAISPKTNDGKSENSELRKIIRHYAVGMDTQSLISTIRSVAQNLLDCDRGTVYLREGNNLVIKSQGLEQEIPMGFEIPLGKGIAGYVAQTGLAENIKDVYSDSRFNPEVDRLTGFKTSTMLCTPVLDYQGNVIAAFQMINKRGGEFDQYDEDTLEVFSELISFILQNWKLFQKNIEERTALANILNSIGHYVLVLNSEGMLEYNNRPFENIFGVTEAAAKELTYPKWMEFNRQLVLDITSIYNYPYRRIHRKSQKISPVTRKSIFPELQGSQSASSIFNYTLVPLQDFMNDSSTGVIVILEDASEIEELSTRLKDMQSQLYDLTNNPVKTETSLQRCIDKLTAMAQDIEYSSDMSAQLIDVINTLKRGNLDRAEVTFLGEKEVIEPELKSYISEYVELPDTVDRRSSVLSTFTNRSETSFLEVEELEVDIESLRNWSLNAFEVEDHFLYIVAMLRDFKFTTQFNINITKLKSFVNEVRKNYHENPFHNFYHGFTVMHSTYYIMATTKVSKIFTDHEIYALIIASLCHDIGHTGHNNAFEVNRSSHYAIVYNDKSVLENHHAALTFQILQNGNSNIFDFLSNDIYKAVRKLIIESILSTDMVKHFNMISSMASRFKDLEDHPLGSLDDDCEKIASLVIHLSDLAHPTKEFDVFSYWSLLVCNEFSNQYADEAEYGLPQTEFMKGLDDPQNYYKNEINFISVIVKPLWECANIWLSPEIDHCMLNLDENIKKYQERLQNSNNK